MTLTRRKLNGIVAEPTEEHLCIAQPCLND